MKRLMTKILKLPRIIVENSSEINETIFLSVRAENKRAICPRCGLSCQAFKLPVEADGERGRGFVSELQQYAV